MEGGFIVDDNNKLRLTQEGYQVCDEITVKVMDLLDAHSVSDHRA